MKHPQLSLRVPFGGQEYPIILHVQELQCKLNTYYLVVNVKCCPFFLGGEMCVFCKCLQLLFTTKKTFKFLF